MSSEDFIRANFRKFDVIEYLQTFGLEDAESAKKLFKRTIDHLVVQKPCPLRKWAKDIKDTNYAIISSTTALDHFIKQSKKRAKQLQDLQILSDRMQDTSARARVTESLAQDDDRSDAETNEHDQSDSYIKRFKYEFKQTFDAMPDQHKWKLSTGTVVEDAMFEFGMKLVKEHFVHSFVLDTLNSVYVEQEVFSKAELHEISRFESKPLAIVPQQLKDYINTFAVN
ncbi:hypothetical protein PS15m_011506 [Mucor circinelloides]